MFDETFAGTSCRDEYVEEPSGYCAGVISWPGTAERVLNHVLAELSITFELVFGKELVGGRLVREAGVGRSILRDAHRLVAGDRSLEVDEVA